MSMFFELFIPKSNRLDEGIEIRLHPIAGAIVRRRLNIVNDRLSVGTGGSSLRHLIKLTTERYLEMTDEGDE